MTPSTPHNMTIGTGESRIIASAVRRLGGHVSIGPSGDCDQSRDAMSCPASPPEAERKSEKGGASRAANVCPQVLRWLANRKLISLAPSHLKRNGQATHGCVCRRCWATAGRASVVRRVGLVLGQRLVGDIGDLAHRHDADETGIERGED